MPFDPTDNLPSKLPGGAFEGMSLDEMDSDPLGIVPPPQVHRNWGQRRRSEAGREEMAEYTGSAGSIPQLLDYYADGLKTVDAVGAVDEVFARALRALGR